MTQSFQLIMHYAATKMALEKKGGGVIIGQIRLRRDNQMHREALVWILMETNPQ